MGKGKHSNDTRGDQQGAQAQGEGQHGAVTHAHLQQQLKSHGGEEEGAHGKREANDPNRDGKGSKESHAEHDKAIDSAGDSHDGRHPLFENRKQHDEGDRAQAKNRLDKDVEQHDHEREQFQLEGGRETHPSLPQDGSHGTIKSPGKGGG